MLIPKKTEREVVERMNEWMPNTTSLFESAVEEALYEEQDQLYVVFGPPGKGKSNMGFLLTTLLSKLTRQEYDLEEQTAWLGEDYLDLFKEPARKFAALLEQNAEQKLESLIEGNRGTVWWLDEAKDLNSKEFMKPFNRAMSGILATCRALQYIYILCIDTPTKLLPSIREYRVSGAIYTYLTDQEHEFPDGKERVIRNAAIYTGEEWSNIIFSDLGDVRRNLAHPYKFTNRYPPSIGDEHIPLFPRHDIFDRYVQLKYGNMGKIILSELHRTKDTEKQYTVRQVANMWGDTIERRDVLRLGMEGHIPIDGRRIPHSYLKEVNKKLQGGLKTEYTIASTKEEVEEMREKYPALRFSAGTALINLQTEDPYKKFVKENITAADGGVVRKREVYARYEEFCERNKIEVPAYSWWVSQMNDTFEALSIEYGQDRKRPKGKSIKRWKGIQLK